MPTTMTRSIAPETCARYLAAHGPAKLRAMASEWRLFANHAPRGSRPLPPRYAIAADVVVALGL